jgi:hypothetical protein
MECPSASFMPSSSQKDPVGPGAYSVSGRNLEDALVVPSYLGASAEAISSADACNRQYWPRDTSPFSTSVRTPLSRLCQSKSDGMPTLQAHHKLSIRPRRPSTASRPTPSPVAPLVTPFVGLSKCIPRVGVPVLCPLGDQHRYASAIS